MEFFAFIAQCVPQQGGQKGGGSLLLTFGPLLIIFALFYFLVLGPQRKKDKQHKAYLDNLRRGDKVVTSAGIHGEIYALAPDTIVLEVAPKVRLTVNRSAISGAAPGAAPAASSDDKGGKRKK